MSVATIYGSSTLNRFMPFIPGKLEGIVTNPVVKELFEEFKKTLTPQVLKISQRAKWLDPTLIQFARVGFFAAIALTVFSMRQIRDDLLTNDNEQKRSIGPLTGLCLSLPGACLFYDILQNNNKIVFDLLNSKV